MNTSIAQLVRSVTFDRTVSGSSPGEFGIFQLNSPKKFYQVRARKISKSENDCGRRPQRTQYKWAI